MAMITSRDGTNLTTAEDFTISAGGAESNVAQYLAESGLRTAWLSALGADPLGDRVLQAITASGVDTRWVRRDPSARTGVYFKDPGGQVYYYRSGSAASRMTPDAIASWPLAKANWLHLSGITPALSPTCRELVSAVLDAAEGGVSFDVNFRPALWSPAEAAAVTQPLADRCGIVLVGRDEAEALWGVADAEGIAAVFPNAGRVVVKDGNVEAVEIDRRGDAPTVTRVPAGRVDVIEPVGAGDAFAAGYLATLLRGDTASKALAQGHALAAWVLSSPADYRSGYLLDDRLR